MLNADYPRSNWVDALNSALTCPKCKTSNIPKASPTVTREQDGSLFCSNCSHSWRDKPPLSAAMSPNSMTDPPLVITRMLFS